MKRRIRAIAVLPTLFTLGNLVCGFFAIVIVSRVGWPESVGGMDPENGCALAGVLIFLAMLLDALDGQMARLAKASSKFGAQLDSLADLVSFGVAPGFLMVKLCPQFTLGHGHAAWAIAAAFAVCAALRLARFNVETGENDNHMQFSGLPSPAGAAAVVSYSFLFYALRSDDQRLVYAETIDSAIQWFLPFFTMAVALLMVSRVPYPHLTNLLLRGRRSFRHVVGLVFAAAIVVIGHGYVAPVLCGAFVLLGPAKVVRTALVRRRLARQESGAGPNA